MKLTESKLKQIIKEELQKVLVEQDQSIPGGVSDDRVYGMSRIPETPRQILRRLSKRHGGVKGIRQLSRKDPDRIAYRKAYKAMMDARRQKTPEPGTAVPGEMTTPKSRRSVADMKLPPMVTTPEQAREIGKLRAAIAAAELGGYKNRPKVRSLKRALDRALAATSPNLPFVDKGRKEAEVRKIAQDMLEPTKNIK